MRNLLSYTRTTPLLRPLIVLSLVVLIFGCIFSFPRLIYPSLTDENLRDRGVREPKDRVTLQNERLKLQNDARATLLQGVGGAVLLLGAYFTWRQLQASRETQITDRFTRTIDQLGSERSRLEQRIGGIHAMGRIAKDSPADQSTIIRVLASYHCGKQMV
jgi:hypothetical protein